MFDPAIFCIRVDGKLSESWSDYTSVESLSVQMKEGGCCSTTIVTGPVDQAALVGVIIHLNALGLPIASIECLPTSRDGAIGLPLAL